MKRLKTFKTVRARCPTCGTYQDRATHAYSVNCRNRPRKPRAGDVGVCWNCAAVSIYADDRGNLRQPNEAELKAICADPRLAQLVVGVIDHK